MMCGVELFADVRKKVEYPYGDRVGFKVCQAARKSGVLLRPLGNVVVVMPPLSLTVDEAKLIGDALFDAISRTT
jgi:adenosylmethionine-8-amino-7-oxononanoate aminotransferase